jgi:hypothetical protein
MPKLLLKLSKGFEFLFLLVRRWLGAISTSNQVLVGTILVVAATGGDLEAVFVSIVVAVCTRRGR